MDLVLIACCKTKQPGGNWPYPPGGQGHGPLDSAAFGRLVAARKQVVETSDRPLPRGPELGFWEASPPKEYLPAYQRYIGQVYQAGHVQELFPHNGKICLGIVSALYGLLDADDLIQNYDLRMEDKINGIPLYTWWQQQGLGEIITEYALALDPVNVHDLLPPTYRKALEPWPSPRLGGRVKCYQFPEQSSEAIWRRAEILEAMLRPACA